MTDLASQLERLGLSQYLESFVSEGFDTWATVLDITESDLHSLNVKLGHRRKLQRAIAESRGQPADKSLVPESRKSSNIDRSDDSGTEPKDPHAALGHSGLGGPGSGTKRKYRRHPKPDPNAPERPPSAYVIFSNQVREEIRSQELTFTEIAKVVGERWQVLPTEVKEACENQANAAKDRYSLELSEYKKTTDYTQYQEYLVDFKIKYGHSRIEGKRSKLESEVAAPILGSMAGLEMERKQGSRSAPVTSASGSSRPSPPSLGGAHHPGLLRASSSASSALYSDVTSSPARADPKSPNPRSPALSALSGKDARAVQLPHPYQESRAREMSHHGHATLAPAQTPFQSPGYQPSYEGWLDAPASQQHAPTSLPRRASRTKVPTPPLVRNDSTISSVGSAGSSHLPTLSMLPLDSKMPTRTLPQPIVGGGGGGGTRGLLMGLRHPSGAAAVTMTALPQLQLGPVSDPQRSANLGGLLRAIEIAAEQEGKPRDMLKEESP